jgi:hypothetical protein
MATFAERFDITLAGKKKHSRVLERVVASSPPKRSAASAPLRSEAAVSTVGNRRSR